MYKKILTIITLLLAITSVSASNSMFEHINWNNTIILEHHYYNSDLIYYKNSLNRTIWVPRDDFIEYFIDMKYGYKKFPSKIDKIERKGEMMKGGECKKHDEKSESASEQTI
jgi:hypothetical protein